MPPWTDDLCINSVTVNTYHEPYTEGRINLETLEVSYVDSINPVFHDSTCVSSVSTSLDATIPSHLCDFDLQLREAQDSDTACTHLKHLALTGSYSANVTASKEREYSKYLAKYYLGIYFDLLMVKSRCDKSPSPDRRPWKRYLPSSLVMSILNEFHNTSSLVGI